ncbi:MAG: hypothetical protein HW382_487, partial [Deltaproteobacteria bacterium]|nr:hypothetical protein [Deltaproteobacteria bacterium]
TLYNYGNHIVQGLMDMEEGREMSLADVKKHLGLK